MTSFDPEQFDPNPANDLNDDGTVYDFPDDAGFDYVEEEEDWLDEDDYARHSEDDCEDCYDDDGYFWGDDDDPVGDNIPDTDDYEY